MNEKDVIALENYLRAIPYVEEQATQIGTYKSPVLVCVDAVLSINRKYFAFVVPRIQMFQNQHSDVVQLSQVCSIIKTGGIEAFYSYWNYRHESRVCTLAGLCRFYIDYRERNGFTDDLEAMQNWAHTTSVIDSRSFPVQGIGIATFQYLRMLLGAETVKPDVHIKEALREAIGRSTSEIEAILIFEEACRRMNMKPQYVDHNVWSLRASSSKIQRDWLDGSWVDV